MQYFFIFALLLAGSQSHASTYQKAATAFGTMAYLDRDHTRTGCFARATFVSLELREQNIEAFNVFIFGEFYPTDNYFNYHVAAGFYDKDKSSEPFVIDPIFSDQPITLAAWIQLLKPKSNDITIKLRPAGEFGSPDQIKSRKSLIQLADKSPPEFTKRQIAFACQTLHRLLEFHPQKRTALQQQLVGRYVYFMDGRDPEGPIEYAPSISCIPEPTDVKGAPKAGTFHDKNWPPSGIEVTVVDTGKSMIKMEFRFASLGGSEVKVVSTPFKAQQDFAGYHPIYDAEQTLEPAGFLTISVISPFFIRGQLFGTPFVAARTKAPSH